jgi:hypothetical protein
MSTRYMLGALRLDRIVARSKPEHKAWLARLNLAIDALEARKRFSPHAR